MFCVEEVFPLGEAIILVWGLDVEGILITFYLDFFGRWI
jgi:hypothetical protein